MVAALLAGGLGLGVGWAVARTTYPAATVLLQDQSTVIGQRIAYPSGEPQVTGAIVSMAPGQATGWHRHDAPLFAYMLEGELTVDYGPHGSRRYVEGEALLEAVEVAHNGTNTGAATARVLVVFMGAAGLANTIEMPAPD
jgi:quercetin dioxygenase-like cupin family protein